MSPAPFAMRNFLFHSLPPPLKGVTFYERRKTNPKIRRAIRSAQEIALEYGNPQIEQVHLLWALLQDSEGLIPQLLAGMGVTVPSLQAAVKDLLARQPRVSNSGHEAGKIYISGDTEKALNRAEKVAGEMKDEYTSVEHLFLGLLDTAGGSWPSSSPSTRSPGSGPSRPCPGYGETNG